MWMIYRQSFGTMQILHMWLCTLGVRLSQERQWKLWTWVVRLGQLLFGPGELLRVEVPWGCINHWGLQSTKNPYSIQSENGSKVTGHLYVKRCTGACHLVCWICLNISVLSCVKTLRERGLASFAACAAFRYLGMMRSWPSKTSLVCTGPQDKTQIISLLFQEALSVLYNFCFLNREA